jgi:non-heme chloroperoxidase
MTGKRENYFRTSDDAIIYFEDHGSGKPIVLVPGFVCSTKFFEKNIEGLAKTNRVITFDPRGQGNSSKGLQGHTIARNAQDIKELLEHLDVNNATLLGWSMSGQFVLKYHMLYGNLRIDSIGLLDCPLGAMYDEVWNAHHLKGFNMDGFNGSLAKSYNDNEGYCAYFAKMVWAGNDDSKIEWSTKEFLKTPAWISFAIYSDMVFQNGYEMLPKVTLPIIFMGANSAVTANGKELATKYYPENTNPAVYKESHTFDKGGHVFFYCNPEEFNAKVAAFAKKVSEKK